MTEELMREILETQEPKEIFLNYILGNDIWYFKEKQNLPNWSNEYDRFKRVVSRALNININNVAIVGSAQLGFSLAPKKLFSPFSNKSDIDVILVSQKEFFEFWDALLEIKSQGNIQDYNRRTSEIFRKFVSPESLRTNNNKHVSWQKKTGPLLRDLQVSFSISESINYRIYDSWESVERYHLDSIHKVSKILKEGQQ